MLLRLTFQVKLILIWFLLFGPSAQGRVGSWCELLNTMKSRSRAQTADGRTGFPESPQKTSRRATSLKQKGSDLAWEAALIQKAKDPQGLQQLLDELNAPTPNLAKVGDLIDPNSVRNASPESLVEKMLLIERKLSGKIPPTKTDLDLLKLVDEINGRPGSPLARAYEAVGKTCKIQ